MDRNKNCSVCNIKLDINNYKKDRTVCKDCYNKKKRKNNLIQQPKIESRNDINNNRTLLVGPSFPGKTYLMLKILSQIPNRDIYIITKSPQEQYTNCKIKIKEISDEIKPLNEYENGIIVFDDILGSSNSRFIDQFSLEDVIPIYIFIIYHNPILIWQREQYEKIVIKLFCLIKR